MVSADKLGTDMQRILDATWNVRSGTVVPQTEDVVLANGAVKLDAVVLYADLFHSTEMQSAFPNSMVARIVRAYLSSMTRLINDAGGHVRSFDGDRVMGVFVGVQKNSVAARCALKMNYVVDKMLRPRAEAKFPSLVTKGFAIDHCAGIARSEVLVVRGGVRGSNDLVFVGQAPNLAAKLSEIRESPSSTWITWSVYQYLHGWAKIGSNGNNMWTSTKRQVAGQMWDLYRSGWTWTP